MTFFFWQLAALLTLVVICKMSTKTLKNVKWWAHHRNLFSVVARGLKNLRLHFKKELRKSIENIENYKKSDFLIYIYNNQ